ncbi:MAG: hypothetical protein RQ754_02850 [Desulfuromonadales bacterium]|nr:hypothetical protein [Desulfuromonadales bacterium]
MRARIVQALPEHIPMIAQNVREDDRREFAALWTTAEQAMRAGLPSATAAWTGLVDDEPICMFGVSPVGFLLPEQGRPWMMGTDRLDEHAVLFLRRCRPVIRDMLRLYPHLVNHVASFNVRAVQWLKWLGFSVDEENPVNLGKGVPFYRFEMRRPA